MRQQKESYDIEREITAVRIDRLKASPIKGNYDFKHLSAIHKRIFDKLYDHAGQKRPKTEIWAKQGHMSFRSIFADIDNAEKMIDNARDKLGDFKNLAKEEFVDKFTEAYAEVTKHTHLKKATVVRLEPCLSNWQMKQATNLI